jgi:predicted PurR-regulated permease PerM
MIDGVLIATALLILGLDFAILIGIMVCFLGLIPYLGMMICYIPAVIIAAAQFGDWFHPLAVTLIFILANNLEGIFIAPKIVGESVGLHPLTVILSVLAWSLILGGLLGAILAVPLTATLKVLLKRYFWDKPPRLRVGDPPPA